MQAIGEIRVLEVAAPVMGTIRPINPAVVLGPGGALLVDSGFPGAGTWEALQEELARAEMTWDKIRAVIVTHQDWDHIGGLPAALAATGGKAELLCHEEEKPFIQGERPPVKRVAGGAPIPEDWQKVIDDFVAARAGLRVSRTMADGEVLPYGGGTVVIHTPGHTPGHICLYVKGAKTLLAGDAMVIEEGKLLGPREQFTPDRPRALASLKKLADYDIETVVCYHGGVYRGEANRRIAEIANDKSLGV
jgi:glyoxylase-like metal-dependent hydrolase (beta-lactamase superfamily II)